MSKAIILDGELSGFLRDFAIPYEMAVKCWNDLGGKSTSYPRTEDEFAQLFSVISEGRKWLYAVDISRIYEDCEEKNNSLLLSKLREVVRLSESSDKFVFCGSPIRLFVYDGEILGVGHDGKDVWLDMETFELTSQNLLEMKVKNCKKARTFFRWTA